MRCECEIYQIYKAFLQSLHDRPQIGLNGDNAFVNDSCIQESKKHKAETQKTRKPTLQESADDLLRNKVECYFFRAAFRRLR